MSSLKIIRGPNAEPLDLATEVKPHLRVTISDDDKLLKLYLQAARELGESETGLSFVNKTYRQSHDRFPRRHDYSGPATGYWYPVPRYAQRLGDERQEIKLLRSPLLAVEMIEYVDVTGTVQSLRPTPELWRADTEYSVGDQVEDANGNLQEITAANDDLAEEDGSFESGSGTPTWSAVLGNPTTDGPFTWTCKRIPAGDGDFIVDRDSDTPRILPPWGETWPATRHVPQAVRIYFNAGYGTDESALPATAKLLMLQLIGSWYENREAVTPDTLKTIPYHLENLVWSMRVTDYAPTK